MTERYIIVLREYAKHMVTTGQASREELLEYLQSLRDYTENEEQEEDILIVMDHLVGWCNPQWRI